MMSNYVIAVYVSFWSWHVHGSHSVYLQNWVWQRCKWQIEFNSINKSCESPELLMTASTTSIPVLHSAEVVPCTHKSCYLSSTGLYGPHTPLPRKRGRVTLWGLYKVPLASENSLQFLGSAMQESPVWLPSQQNQPENLPTRQLPYCPCPFWVR
jgi:hypothetical protein